MALPRSSPSWSAHMLAAADDYYATSVIPTVLGNITPHSTGMPALTPVEKHDQKIWDVQRQFYEYSISNESPFTYVKNQRFRRSNYDQLSIVAKRKINKGEIINGLLGATYRIEKTYIYEGINDYSLIYSDRAKSDMLFLGPAAFCNHACVPNATLKCINKKLTGVVALKTINPAEEISVFYSKNYFENNNEQCNCVTCFEIKQRNSTCTSDSQITYATPESEIDCTFFGNVVTYTPPKRAAIDVSDQQHIINSASEEIVIGHTTSVMSSARAAIDMSDQQHFNSTSDEVIGQTTPVMQPEIAAIDVSDQQLINSTSEEIVIGHTTPVMHPESHAKDVSDQQLINSASDEVVIGQTTSVMSLAGIAIDVSDQQLINSASEEVVIGQTISVMSSARAAIDVSDQQHINSTSDEIVIGQTTPVMQPESHAKDMSDQQHFNSTSDEIVIGHTTSVMSLAGIAIDVSDQQLINSASEEVVIGQTTSVKTINISATHEADTTTTSHTRKKKKIVKNVGRYTIPLPPNVVKSVQRADSSSDSESSKDDESSDEFENNDHQQAEDDDDDDDDNDDDDDDDDSKQNRFSCPKCSKSYEYKSWLERHFSAVHSEMYPCQFCPKYFSRKYKLQMHTQEHTGPKKHKCTQCNSTYNDKSNLTKHFKLKHDPNRKDIECVKCGVTFTCQRNLSYHMNTHENKKPYECTICGERFTSPAFVSKHKKKNHCLKHKSTHIKKMHTKQ